MASTKDFVRTILRTRGPLSLADMVQEAADKGDVPTRNPKQTISNAISQDTLVQNTGEGTYAYLPTFIREARMLIPMDDAVLGDGYLRVPGELVVFLWPFVDSYSNDAKATLQFSNNAVEIGYPHWQGAGIERFYRMVARLELPAPFWTWWEAHAAEGADTIVVRCVDGESGMYRAEAARSGDANVEEQTAIDEAARGISEAVLRRTQDGVMFIDLVRRLLARGIYHQHPPSPLTAMLFDPPGHFLMERGIHITFRPEMTPAIRALFAQRLRDQEEDILFLKGFGFMQPPLDEQVYNYPADTPPTAVYRFKVSLAWKKSVWRVIEILDNQTLEDFHDIIQKAFDWDDDHLYAFYASNRPSDGLTVILRPTEFEYDPPHANEVTVGMLDLKVGQQLLYVFDFGDHLDHTIELMKIVDLPTEGKFPRIILSRGEAPAQYPDYEDEDDEE